MSQNQENDPIQPQSPQQYAPQQPETPIASRNVEAGASTASNSGKDPFYKKTWFVVLMLIIFPPVGIPLAWVFKKPGSQAARIVLTIFSAIILLYAVFAPKTTASSVSTSNGVQSEQKSADSEEKKEVDKSVLKFSIDKFSELDSALYTPETFAAMASALDAAKQTYDNNDATESEVVKATSDLSTASNNLKEVFNPDNYAAVAYVDLARNPDTYKGQNIVISGKVLQVSESTKEIDLRVATDGGYDDVVMVGYDPKLMSSRVLEDDVVIVYGNCIGLYTYTSTLGASISVPGLYADNIEIQ